MNDKHLYIPYGLIIEKQWWDGCGPKQKPQFVIGGLISLGLATVIFLLVHVIIGLAVGIFGILATVALVSKQDKTNLSMIDYIGLMIRKTKSSRIFFISIKMIMGLCDENTQQVRHCDAPIHRSISVYGCNSRSSE